MYEANQPPPSGIVRIALYLHSNLKVQEPSIRHFCTKKEMLKVKSPRTFAKAAWAHRSCRKCEIVLWSELDQVGLITSSPGKMKKTVYQAVQKGRCLR